MSAETSEIYEMTPSEIIVADCTEQLKAAGIPEDRVEHLTEMLKNSLERDDLIGTIVERVTEEHDVFEETITQDLIEKMTRGHTFESFALESLPPEEKQYKELERFLLWSLKDPRIWYMDWEEEQLVHLSKEEKKLLKTYMNVRPDPDEMKSLRNNDAISISITKDEETGQTVALITGVVEAKNHRLRSGGSDERQMNDAPEILYDTIRRYGRSFPLILKGLDLGGEGIPDQIKILPPEELKYTVLQPADLEQEYQQKPLESAYAHTELKFIPVTRDEIKALGDVLKKYVIAELPEEIQQELEK